MSTMSRYTLDRLDSVHWSWFTCLCWHPRVSLTVYFSITYMYQISKTFGTLNIRGTPCHFLLGNFPLPPSGGQHHHLHWTIKKKIDFNVFAQHRRKLGYSIQRSVFIFRHVSPGGPKPVLVDTPGSPWWIIPLMLLCMRYLCRCSSGHLWVFCVVDILLSYYQEGNIDAGVMIIWKLSNTRHPITQYGHFIGLSF